MNNQFIYDNNRSLNNRSLYGNDFFSIEYTKQMKKERRRKRCKICGFLTLFIGFNVLSFSLGYFLN